MEILKKQMQGQRESALREKFSKKSYSESWAGLRLAVGPLGLLIQLFTASLVVGGFAWGFKILTGSWAWGFALGGVFVLAFEVVKRMIVYNTSISYFRNIAEQKPRKLSRVGVLALVVVLGVSISSSVISTPLLVEEFAPMPPPPREDLITSRFDSLKEEASSYWGGVKKDALEQSKEMQEKNTWKGVISWKAQDEILTFETQAAASVDSLNGSLATLSAMEVQSLDKAQREYEDASRKRQGDKNLVGSILGFATLALELLFLLCYSWLNYYDFCQAAELGLIGGQSSKQSSPKVAIDTDFIKQSSGESLSKVKEEPSQRGGGIGFNNEGRVFEEGGKLLILCKTRGGLKAYDSSYLGTLLRDAERKAQPRADYWREMKCKLERAKQNA
jgi:hypothetical protein